MIELPVRGADKPALVDDELAWLLGYKWSLNRDGYVNRRAHGKRILLHQTVMPGKHWPSLMRDHINRDKMDNRSTNLRWVTPTESSQNRGCAKRNKLGIKGVRFDKSSQCFKAALNANGVRVHTSYHSSPEQAAAALESIRYLYHPTAYMPLRGAVFL